MDIKLIGDRITVMLNGKKVIKNAQIPGLPARGPIGLQHHGGIIPETGEYGGASSLIQFRNIWIEELDQPLTTDEDGWKTLFNGQDLTGWKTGPNNAFTVENGQLTVKRAMDGQEHNFDYLWTEDQYGDFILDLEFKVIEGTNSGIFFRTSDIMDPVYTGIEVQVANSFGREELSRGATAGAIYDLVVPTANPIKPPGEWNRYRITARGSQIDVELNGVHVASMDVDQWTETGKNPDGSENKFTKPIKDFARKGHIGLQDHGQAVWYRNIRVKSLDRAGSN